MVMWLLDSFARFKCHLPFPHRHTYKVTSWKQDIHSSFHPSFITQALHRHSVSAGHCSYKLKYKGYKSRTNVENQQLFPTSISLVSTSRVIEKAM